MNPFLLVLGLHVMLHSILKNEEVAFLHYDICIWCEKAVWKTKKYANWKKKPIWCIKAFPVAAAMLANDCDPIRWFVSKFFFYTARGCSHSVNVSVGTISMSALLLCGQAWGLIYPWEIEHTEVTVILDLDLF